MSHSRIFLNIKCYLLDFSHSWFLGCCYLEWMHLTFLRLALYDQFQKDNVRSCRSECTTLYPSWFFYNSHPLLTGKDGCQSPWRVTSQTSTTSSLPSTNLYEQLIHSSDQYYKWPNSRIQISHLHLIEC